MIHSARYGSHRACYYGASRAVSCTNDSGTALKLLSPTRLRLAPRCRIASGPKQDTNHSDAKVNRIFAGGPCPSFTHAQWSDLLGFHRVLAPVALSEPLSAQVVLRRDSLVADCNSTSIDDCTDSSTK